jgi:hypothetical protein
VITPNVAGGRHAGGRTWQWLGSAVVGANARISAADCWWGGGELLGICLMSQKDYVSQLRMGWWEGGREEAVISRQPQRHFRQQWHMIQWISNRRDARMRRGVVMQREDFKARGDVSWTRIKGGGVSYRQEFFSSCFYRDAECKAETPAVHSPYYRCHCSMRLQIPNHTVLHRKSQPWLRRGADCVEMRPPVAHCS